MREKWNYDLLQKRKELRKDLDFSLVTRDQVQSYESFIPVKCCRCYQVFTTRIRHIFYNKVGCTRCTQHRPWNLQRLLEVAKHNVNIDLSHLREGDVTSSKSIFKVNCLVCGSMHPTSVRSLSFRYRCPFSTRGIWNKSIFAEEKRRRPDIDFGKTNLNKIRSCSSVLTCICRRCKCEWKNDIDSILIDMEKCPECYGNSPKGRISSVMVDKYPSFERDVVISGRPFDFYFEHQGKKCLISYDDVDHFLNLSNVVEERKRFCRALDLGYFVIHIDYSQVERFLFHLTFSLHNEGNCYFASHEKYNYLFNVK